MTLKEKLVGTAPGRCLQELARRRALRALPVRNPELASATANAILTDRLIARLCPPGGTLLDIGAHIGSVFSAAHAVVPDVQIIAIEADPGKAASLRRRFPKIDLHECAVGETDGTTKFYMSAHESGYNALQPRAGHAQTTVQVRMQRLDTLLPDVTPDLIKMDIEGAELGALKGGEALIARARPAILFESMGDGVNALGYSPAGLWDWLDAHGFGVCTPDRLAHDAPPMTRNVFLDAHFYPFRTHNYFAVPAEKRIEIRDRARRILNVQL